MERKFKSPDLMKARDNLFKFLKENKLDPDKDYSNDPKYGKEYRRLLLRLQIERDKIMVNYPNSDIKNRKKYYKMKKDKKEKKAKAAQEEQKAKVVKAVKKEKTEKKEKVSRGAKYDYPLVNGKEMTAAEKKKYRAEQRRLAAEKANPEKPSKEKKTKEKKSKETSSDTKSKKVKKNKKVED